MAAKIFRINYKSDFILTLNSDAGWLVPFCIKFWTGAPTQAYFAGWDGETYTHCAYDPSEPTKLVVQFDDHHLPIGELKYQVAYHFTVADFPNDTEDEVLNQASVIIEVDDEPAQVMLDLNGETAPEIEFSLPAYANEAQRIANEEQRIAHEATRIDNEESRIAAETIRQQNEEQRINNEAQRIRNEEARIAEFAQIKEDATEATDAANSAAALANEKAQLADDKAQLATDKATLAQSAATLATEKAQLAADKAALAASAAQLADEKAALAQQKATYAEQQGDYAKAQGDYAKAQGDYAKAQAGVIPVDVTRTASDATFVNSNHDSLFYLRQATSSLAGLMTAAEHNKLDALPTAQDLNTSLESIIYDVSANHPTAGPNSDGKFTLAYILNPSNVNTLIPTAVRKGGMSIKFVHTSDNNYVQYRCVADEFSINEEDWEQAASVAQLEELEDNAVMTGSYDATVAVGLADNLRGDTVVNAEFYYRKTGGTQSVGSGIAAIKEVRGKSIVWNQAVSVVNNASKTRNGITFTTDAANQTVTLSGANTSGADFQYGLNNITNAFNVITPITGHKCIYWLSGTDKASFYYGYYGTYGQKRIHTADNNQVSFQIKSDADFSTPVVVKLNAIDLTLEFGAGNEPATVAEFEKIFPLDYYDYNEGEIIPFAGQNLVTTGFNQWDEQYEVGYAISATTGVNIVNAPCSVSKNYIKVFPSTMYQNTNGSWDRTRVAFYREDKSFISLFQNTNAGTFTTPADCRYIKFYWLGTTYNHDICINISNPDRDGTYEPYEKHILPLDPSQWRDKNGELVFPYGGMHGVGNAYDYAKVDADGYIRRAVRCVGSVNLGSLYWDTRWWQEDGRLYVNLSSKAKGIRNIIYPLGETKANDNAIINNVGICGNNDNSYIYIGDAKQHASAKEFMASLSGVFAYYELATPVEVELATPVYAKYLVDKDGTEEITPANGAAPYTTPANLSILYAMDARGTIANLPKNYLSKESAENMLNAMVAAGVISSYTMTFDTATGQYVFVINNVQPNNETE